ncbi:MAG: excinuclease ABC subunit UvrA [Eubacteriales bacterium]
MDHLYIKGARVHNLKNIDVTIPRDKLVVITGLSGSGKSSLAFDTIYAEGQRRYVESLSAYARQFLGQMDKPEVDYIEGLSPAISIDQKTTSKNPRSTVGTVTEIHDYLRLLYARAGTPHCVKCGKPIQRQTVDQMVEEALKLDDGTRLLVLAPVVRGRKGEYKKLFERLMKSGFVRAIVDGITYNLDEDIPLEKNKKHTIDLVVDRLVVGPDIGSRLASSFETAMHEAEGLVKIKDPDSDYENLFSQHFACADCGISMEEISPRMFSFNNPYGACPACHGLGFVLKVDPDLIVPDKTLSLNKGAINAPGWHSAGDSNSWNGQYFLALSKHYNFSLDTPFEDLPKKAKDVLLYGSGKEKIKVNYQSERGSGVFETEFEGIINVMERRYRETNSDAAKSVYEELMNNSACEVCHGRRLRDEALAVKIGDKNIMEVSNMSISDCMAFFEQLELSEQKMLIAERVVKEIKERLSFLINVGLNYLTLSRSAGTLSGGEAQRIRLATQIGSGLMGVLYILDEPSIGLHQRDNSRLIETLKNLKTLGNTLIVVEHDEETILSADYVLDIGPGAGSHGGKVVSAGTPDEIMADKKSITGQYLSGIKSIPIPAERRTPRGEIVIRGAEENNLKGIDAPIMLGVVNVVTGVSGSGKSSLINEILFKSLAKSINRAKTRPGKHKDIAGAEALDKIVDIDQSPIGRTPRSNPATYTGMFTHIRDIFAATEDAKIAGYNKGRFSFNVKGGRCEACSGDGIIKIEMHFLPDVYVPCEVCKGKRYNRETLEVKYKDKNIYEVLDMTVEEAHAFFKAIPRIHAITQVLMDVGLSYIKLGQPSTTLSGGEAQRIKLATHLAKRQTGNTLYILDEPTTGLHMADVNRLVGIIDRLADKGNTIVIIEHNLDVIKCGDYVLDLGPEGGDKGGEIIATGTPEEIAKVKGSYTGQYLKKALAKK